MIREAVNSILEKGKQRKEISTKTNGKKKKKTSLKANSYGITI